MQEPCQNPAAKLIVSLYKAYKEKGCRTRLDRQDAAQNNLHMANNSPYLIIFGF